MRLDWKRLAVYSACLAFSLGAWALLIWAVGTMFGRLGLT